MPDDLQQDQQRDNGGQRPVPDPTVLTTEALQREVGGLERLVERDIEGLRQSFNENLEGKNNVIQEQLRSVATQFAERDTRQERETRDNTVKVDAAFAAAKEAAAKQDEANQKAIDKSERATAEKIEKLAELFQTSNDAIGTQLSDLKEGLGAQISDLKQRVTTIESTRSEARIGRTEHAEQRAVSFGQVTAIVMAAVAILGLVIVAANALTKGGVVLLPW